MTPLGLVLFPIQLILEYLFYRNSKYMSDTIGEEKRGSILICFKRNNCLSRHLHLFG